MLQNETFGQYIRSLRLNKGWTQNEVCEKANIKFTYLSKIENDKSAPPSEEVLFRLAIALEENPYWFIILAGKVPKVFQDIILNDKDTVDYLLNKVSERLNEN
ncbi:helix-turn-helix domain-containing protein [Paenibacillus sp. IHBB 10380]|jgi:transcriptional regulator with XRE-family HTH domain|uniref:helix-turn-helix domain-containing protein n=1 Tax=Paenibacillus sp. IHBB 10380 TaxID=1566358 RepID=UPI0006967B87|nr:helix-turn-helix transcriptional regulator [Paenibacillus sp. IHBB 10380]